MSKLEAWMTDAEKDVMRQLINEHGDGETDWKYVWCPLREQHIPILICSRMQSQHRIYKQCLRSGCRHVDADWAERLQKARKADDPKGESLGNIRTDSFKFRAAVKRKKRGKRTSKKDRRK